MLQILFQVTKDAMDVAIIKNSENLVKKLIEKMEFGK